MPSLIFAVTGATSGIGAALVNNIIARGDRVVATGRNVHAKLGHLQSDRLALVELDINASLSDMKPQVREAWDAFGHIDVLINNAGMSAMRSAEEADENYVNTMFQVNLFGHMRVTQIILPLLAARGHGCIAFTSSSSLWDPLPFMSHYAAAKAGLSTYVTALQREVDSLGIRCVAFECGGFPTNLGQPRQPSQARFGEVGPAVEAYVPVFNALVSKFAADPMAYMPGDVTKVAERIVDVVKMEGQVGERPWSVRMVLGSDALRSAKERCMEQLENISIWQDVSISTDREIARTISE